MSLLAMGHAAFAADAKKSTPEKSAPDFGPTMRFVVVRSSAPGCEPTCPEWISAEGSIEAGTPALFKRALKALGGRKLPIVVDSPGGNVEAALTLGRLIRKNKLDIAVGKTGFVGCLPDMKNCKENDGKGARYFGDAYANGAICNSACPLMFSGGIRRVVGEWAFLGVHQITTTYIRTKLLYRTTYRMVKGKKKILSTRIVSRRDAGSYKTYEMNKPLERRLSAYLKEMGIEGRAGYHEGNASQRYKADQAGRYAGDEARHQPRVRRHPDGSSHMPAEPGAGELQGNPCECQAGRGGSDRCEGQTFSTGSSPTFSAGEGGTYPAGRGSAREWGAGDALRCGSRQQSAVQSQLPGMDLGGRRDYR
ncbi:hypothetical protein [Mesorhizobium sp. M0700]|uniref:COG3904 family protein n=1 Tax=Mesorhizobium sp. M0700 TaxID=2956988 RepID=UPI003336CE2B